MKYLSDDLNHIEFEDLRGLMRRGQIYSLDFDFQLYGKSQMYCLYITVIRSSGLTDKFRVGEICSSEQELWGKFQNAMSTEPAADFLHFEGDSFPKKAVCGCGRFAKLCGIDRTSDSEVFQSAPNKCLKCWVYLVSNKLLSTTDNKCST